MDNGMIVIAARWRAGSDVTLQERLLGLSRRRISDRLAASPPAKPSRDMLPALLRNSRPGDAAVDRSPSSWVTRRLRASPWHDDLHHGFRLTLVFGLMDVLNSVTARSSRSCLAATLVLLPLALVQADSLWLNLACWRGRGLVDGVPARWDWWSNGADLPVYVSTSSRS